MAVSGAEPISAENLRAVIRRVGREVLFAGREAIKDRSLSLYVVGSLDEFDSFVIECMEGGSVLFSAEVPATAGEHALYDSTTVDISTEVGGIYLYFYSYYSTFAVLRILGVRSGG